MKTLIIVGQTPPPHNGQAKMIDLMIRHMREVTSLVHIRMAYSDSVVSAGKLGIRKIGHLFSLARKTSAALKAHPNSVLYYPPASPNLIPLLRDILFLFWVRRRASNLVFHFHSGGLSTWLASHPLLRRVTKRTHGQPDLAIELGASCPRDGDFFKAKSVCIVPNGMDVPLLSAAPRAAMSTRILYVGIHTADKGLFDIIEIARLLKEKRLSFTIATVGLWYTSHEQAQFETLVKKHELESVLTPLGEKTGTDLWREYAQSDIFLFPTHYKWETFGIVQLEAMAYGLPIVASHWPGPQDVIVDGETGILCAPRDAKSMANAVETLIRDSELRQRMGNAGRKRYEEHYTGQHFGDNIRSALFDILEATE